MCGIVGYVGARDAVSTVLSGLYALSYRGYDSAGIAYHKGDRLQRLRRVGDVACLACAVRESKEESSLAIGHTRWATHGVPTEQNAHPHGTDRVLIVHNGIIENDSSLRKMLTDEGACLSSDTDTECIALLLDRAYGKTGDIRKALWQTVATLEGAYAIAALFRDDPAHIYAIRRQCPLVVGIAPDGMYLSSDLPALLPHTQKYTIPDEGRVLVLARDSLRIENEEGSALPYTVKESTASASVTQKGRYEHHMRKEIEEEPDVLRRTLAPYISDGLPDFSAHISRSRLLSLDGISAVACGSAYHALLYGARMLEKYARIPVRAALASEYRYFDYADTGNRILLSVSQSGETADTLSSVRHAAKRGLVTLSVVNVPDSAIARESDSVLYTHAGSEVAVASTKAYTAQVALLSLFAVYSALVRGHLCAEEARRLTASLSIDLPRAIRSIIGEEERIAKAARLFTEGKEHFFFVGRGGDADIAAEASLKLKEISYIHSEAYAAGELKHGTLSLIEEGTPTAVIATDRTLLPKTRAAVREILARGGRVLTVTGSDCQIDEGYPLLLPPLSDIASPIASSTVLQLFAYHAAYLRGCAIDKPRNLAKSVTVE